MQKTRHASPVTHTSTSLITKYKRNDATVYIFFRQTILNRLWYSSPCSNPSIWYDFKMIWQVKQRQCNTLINFIPSSVLSFDVSISSLSVLFSSCKQITSYHGAKRKQLMRKKKTCPAIYLKFGKCEILVLKIWVLNKVTLLLLEISLPFASNVIIICRIKRISRFHD